MTTARELIEARAKKLKEQVEYTYVCLDTGYEFETEDEPATYSPFTGSTNIELQEVESEDETEPANGEVPMPPMPMVTGPDYGEY